MDPTCVCNFFTFFEIILYKSNCTIFIFSWCVTHTKIRSKLVFIVTAGSQKVTLWGPQRTPLGILRVKTEIIWQTTIYLFKNQISQAKMVLFIRGSLISELQTWVHYQPNTTKYLPLWFSKSIPIDIILMSHNPS